MVSLFSISLRYSLWFLLMAFSFLFCSWGYYIQGVSYQGRHGRFLAGKAAIVPLLPSPLSNSQNLAKDQALTALPPMVALHIKTCFLNWLWQIEICKLEFVWRWLWNLSFINQFIKKLRILASTASDRNCTRY